MSSKLIKTLIYYNELLLPKKISNIGFSWTDNWKFTVIIGILLLPLLYKLKYFKWKFHKEGKTNIVHQKMRNESPAFLVFSTL